MLGNKLMMCGQTKPVVFNQFIYNEMTIKNTSFRNVFNYFFYGILHKSSYLFFKTYYVANVSRDRRNRKIPTENKQPKP